MKTKSLFFILLFTPVFCSFSQTNPGGSIIKNRNNIKIGYTGIVTGLSRSSGMKKNEKIRTPNFKLEFNRGLTQYIEAGFHLAYTAFDFTQVNWSDTTFSSFKAPCVFYGLNSNIHVLPLFIHENDFRFDIYATLKAGSFFYINANENLKETIEYYWGGGFSFYAFKKAGLYIEYTKGRFNHGFDNYRVYYGITYKFK
jgi:hypothetical protein